MLRKVFFGILKSGELLAPKCTLGALGAHWVPELAGWLAGWLAEAGARAEAKAEAGAEARARARGRLTHTHIVRTWKINT